MGRKLVFCILMGAALVYYFNYKKNITQKTINKLDAEDVIAFAKAVEMLGYEGGRLKTRTAADWAQFKEPNRVELFGKVKSEISQGLETTKIHSDEATMTFKAQDISTIINQTTEVESILLRQNVLVVTRRDTISTNSALFDPKEQKVSSRDYVRITSVNHWTEGNRGFEYDLKNKNFAIYGPAQGEINVP